MDIKNMDIKNMDIKNMDIKIETLDNNSILYKNTCSSVAVMMIPKPWNIPKIRKIGLFGMYIIDACMESFNVSAGSNITINPIYSKITKHINNMINFYLGIDSRGKKRKSTKDEKNKEFIEFISYIKTILNLELDNIVYWDRCVPDIRALGTAEGCISWIYSVLINNSKP
uniref:Uncharacterized protein n=1 Tax=viral metagenome TaxID=1070528 RepID=A0A6C0J438_9ZZZZ